jgi:diguanylate cyclase (GGDEF)-like protein
VNILRGVHAWNKTLSVSVGFGLIAGLGILDYGTGYELSFFVFYLLPVSLLAWKGGTWLGLAGSAVSAVVWAEANITAGQTYSSILIIVWNSGARFVTFALMSLVLSFLKRSIDHLEAMSRTDSLTGAVNTRAFLDQVKTETARARRYRRPFSLVYFDLDNFKSVNDSFGHAAGDDALRTVVSIIRTHVRATDTVARLGGDEFSLLLPEADQEAARIVVAKIRSGVLDEMKARGWPIKVSVGSLTCLDAVLSVDELIKKADDLMYEAKSRGKDNAVFLTLP